MQQVVSFEGFTLEPSDLDLVEQEGSSFGVSSPH